MGLNPLVSDFNETNLVHKVINVKRRFIPDDFARNMEWFNTGIFAGKHFNLLLNGGWFGMLMLLTETCNGIDNFLAKLPFSDYFLTSEIFEQKDVFNELKAARYDVAISEFYEGKIY